MKICIQQAVILKNLISKKIELALSFDDFAGQEDQILENHKVLLRLQISEAGHFSTGPPGLGKTT
jgi:replication-associated recombination protein RarA